MGLQVVHPRIFNVFVQIHIRRCKKKKKLVSMRGGGGVWHYDPISPANLIGAKLAAMLTHCLQCVALEETAIKIFVYLFRCCYVKTLSFDWPDRSSPEWEDGRTKTGNVQEKCSLKMSVSRVSLKNLKLKLN